MNILIIKNVFRSAILFLMLVTLFGCASQGDSKEGDTVLLTEQQKEAIEQEREEMLTMIREDLQVVNQNINDINQRVLEEGTEAALEVESQYSKALKELDTFRDTLETKLNEVENTTDENWNQFKTDIDPYVSKVKNDLDTMSSRIESILSEERK